MEKVYRFDETKGDKKLPKHPLKRFDLWISRKQDKDAAERAVRHGQAIAHGVSLAKDLGNLPGNICTPTYLADRAKGLGEEFPGLRVEILEEADMEALGMGALLSVSRGSRQPAKLIVMEHKGGKPGDKPIVLVGKGLTFDAGGISIKPAEAMDEMKFDMCGGASVLGAVRTAAELGLPVNLVGVVPASENLPDGAANKPGDIVKSMSGQTIEILNTDAEGRLILCDALTYCERFEPAAVIDMATLTGACVVALGRHASGLFTQNEKLAEEILAAGEASLDRAWRLPLWDDYQQELDSNFADMANIGSRWGGAITAACFLARYTKKYPWAHLDIAGAAWLTGKEKGATGRPVALLAELLLQRGGQR
jgi:leucyl aminopeptidase